MSKLSPVGGSCTSAGAVTPKVCSSMRIGPAALEQMATSWAAITSVPLGSNSTLTSTRPFSESGSAAMFVLATVISSIATSASATWSPVKFTTSPSPSSSVIDCDVVLKMKASGSQPLIVTV